MGELTPKQSRDGLDFAEQVAALALKAPHSFARKVLNTAVQRLRKVYGFNPEQKRRVVMAALSDGCSTYQDIVGQTHLDRSQVVKTVQWLVEADEVELYPLSRGDKSGGRPLMYIQLTGRSKSLK